MDNSIMAGIAFALVIIMIIKILEFFRVPRKLKDEINELRERIAILEEKINEKHI